MRFAAAIYVALAACSVVAALPAPVAEPVPAVSAFEKRYGGDEECVKRGLDVRCSKRSVEKRYGGDEECVKRGLEARCSKRSIEDFDKRELEDKVIEKRYGGDEECVKRGLDARCSK